LNDPIHTKAVPDEAPSTVPLAAETPPVDLPAPPAPADAPPAEPPDSATDDPQSLGPILDDALDRMGRRAVGAERPIPLPWSNLSAALGGGLWGGTCVTLVGDTGSGKTQWALQAAVHAAEAGVPVCYVAPESTVDQIAARVLALKGGQRWSDLYVGRSGKDVLDTLRESHAAALKRLPFHIVAGVGTRSSPPDARKLAEWMRGRYPQAHPGARPFLLVLDFVQLLGLGDRDRDDKEMLGRAAYEARQAARDFDGVALLVSTTSRLTRLDSDDAIGIHRDRRQPMSLGRGNPGRLVRTGKDTGEAERESDTVLVLAQEPWAAASNPSAGNWIKVWCAVAKNRAGTRAWCALRFDGSSFEVDLDTSVPPFEEPSHAAEGPATRRSDED
jgi:hypothetical protein